MRTVTITVAGPPGGGKTTAARSLASVLGRKFYSAGELFRERAAKANLSLAEFGALALKDDRIDLKLDEDMIGLAEGAVLLEGRIIGELLERRRMPTFRFFVSAEESTRAKRLSKRDKLSLEQALTAIRERESVERARYLKYYGIDLDRVGRDAQVDTTYLSPERVVIEMMADLPEDLREKV